MDSDSQRKRVLVLALSGHASSVFDDFFESVQKSDREYQVYAIQSQWDNGGHTGFLLKFYEYLFLFKQDFITFFTERGIQSVSPPPPLGDLKSQISRRLSILHNEIPGLSVLFGSKVGLCKVREHVIELFSKLSTAEWLSDELKNKLSIGDDSELLILINEFLNHYENYSNTSQRQEDHSIGNIVLAILYLYSQVLFYSKNLGTREISEISAEKAESLFFKLLKDLRLIPKGVYQELLCHGNITLKARSQNGIEFKGESNFDLRKLVDPELEFGEGNRVDLGSYELLLTDEQVPETEQNFESLLSKVDVIIIPPGSLSNWMPIINRFSNLILRYGKEIVWLPNSFCHVSEPDIREQYVYLKGQFGAKLHVIIPKSNPYDFLDDFTEDSSLKDCIKVGYENEHKRPSDFSCFERMPNVHKLIDYMLVETGIKYNPTSVTSAINEISKRETDENREFKLR